MLFLSRSDDDPTLADVWYCGAHRFFIKEMKHQPVRRCSAQTVIRQRPQFRV
jgi:hypothetical protein